MLYTKDLQEIKSFKNGIINMGEATLFDYVLFYQSTNSLRIKLSNEIDKKAFCLRINKGSSAGYISIPSRIINAYKLFQDNIEIKKLDNTTFIISKKRIESVVEYYPGICLTDQESVPKESTYVTTLMSHGGGISKRFKEWSDIGTMPVIQTIHMNKKHPFIELCPADEFVGNYSEAKDLYDEYGRQLQHFAGEKVSYAVYPSPSNGNRKYMAIGVFRKKFNIPLEHPFDVYQLGRKFYLVPHWQDDSITGEEYDRREEKTEKAFLCEDCNNQNEKEPTLKEIMKVINSFNISVKTSNDEKKQLQERLLQTEERLLQSEKEKESLLIHVRKLSSKLFEIEQKLKVDRNIY